MNKMAKKYWFLAVVIVIVLFVLFFHPKIGTKAISLTKTTTQNFLVVLTPIFILIGLIDVWIDRETMIRIMGDKSGIKGALIAVAFGMVTAVPLYALLPVVGVLLKKGCRLSNVLLFLCASEDIRIPLLLFEISSFGWKFTLLRFGLNLAAVVTFSIIIEKLLPKTEIDTIYKNVVVM